VREGGISLHLHLCSEPKLRELERRRDRRLDSPRSGTVGRPRHLVAPTGLPCDVRQAIVAEATPWKAARV